MKLRSQISVLRCNLILDRFKFGFQRKTHAKYHEYRALPSAQNFVIIINIKIQDEDFMVTALCHNQVTKSKIGEKIQSRAVRVEC